MDKITQSRARLVLDHPWLAGLILRLDPVADVTLDPPTACTDGSRIYYVPAFLDTLTQSQCDGLIAHETLHPAFLHHLRRGVREPERWNIACDIAINQILRDISMELPPGGLFPEIFNLPTGLAAEQYYDMLSSKDAAPCDWGGVRDGAGEGDEQKDERQSSNGRVWKDALADALVKAKQQGVTSAALDLLYDDVVAPRINWESLLLQEIERSRGQDDFSYTVRSRRAASLGLLLPGLYSNRIPAIGIVLDTSGSISREELSLYLATVRSLMDTVEVDRLIVVCADSEITATTEIAHGDTLAIDVKGGGGTDFRPAIEFLERENVPIAIYLTDMQGSFPSDTTLRTIWLATTQEQAPFGATIYIKQ